MLAYKKNPVVKNTTEGFNNCIKLAYFAFLRIRRKQNEQTTGGEYGIIGEPDIYKLYQFRTRMWSFATGRGSKLGL